MSGVFTDAQLAAERGYWKKWFDDQQPPNPYRWMYPDLLEERIDQRRYTLTGHSSERPPESRLHTQRLRPSGNFGKSVTE